MKNQFTKQARCEHANELIKLIASHGRKFFWCESKQQFAKMEVDARGKIWFTDDYSGKRVYTHYHRYWKGFSHGGTLRFLVELMREYISNGEQISIYYIAPIRSIDGGHDMWGYGHEACHAVKASAINLPIVLVESTF